VGILYHCQLVLYVYVYGGRKGRLARTDYSASNGNVIAVTAKANVPRLPSPFYPRRINLRGLACHLSTRLCGGGFTCLPGRVGVMAGTAYNTGLALEAEADGQLRVNPILFGNENRIVYFLLAFVNISFVNNTEVHGILRQFC
jgi:hypothetical protein